jgi:hypothetical protein
LLLFFVIDAEMMNEKWDSDTDLKVFLSRKEG